MKDDIPDPSCTKASIDKQLTQVRKMGVSPDGARQQVRQRAVGCRRGQRADRAAVNSANFLETGSFWDMRHCSSSYPSGVQDKDQVAAPDPNPFQQRDAIFGAIEQVSGVTPLSPPLYAADAALQPPRPHRPGRLHDPRHGQAAHALRPRPHERGRSQGFADLLEGLHYPGVVSSHSWATPDAYPRIYKLGGFITPYAGDSTGFVTSGASTCSGRTRATTGASATAPT